MLVATVCSTTLGLNNNTARIVSRHPDDLDIYPETHSGIFSYWVRTGIVIAAELHNLNARRKSYRHWRTERTESGSLKLTDIMTFHRILNFKECGKAKHFSLCGELKCFGSRYVLITRFTSHRVCSPLIPPTHPTDELPN